LIIIVGIIVVTGMEATLPPIIETETYLISIFGKKYA